MRWGSSISAADELDTAVARASLELERQLDGPADLLFVFVSHHHRPRWHEIPAALRDRFSGSVLVGCSAGGVIGDGDEIEQAPGLALAGASLPGVELTTFHLPAERTPDPVEPIGDGGGGRVGGDSGDGGRGRDREGHEAERLRWNRALGLADGPDPHLVLLPDPFTWTGPELLDGLDRAYPSGVKVGGLSSGGGRPGEHRLFCDRSAHHRGVVGVALRGEIEIETVVAQGCTPIGAPMFVTRHQQQIIYELDGRPAVEILAGLVASLGPADRERARNSLLLGVVMDPQRQVYERGDFLVRDVVGVDPETGALATGVPLYEHAVVQFHVRDAQTASADLSELLAATSGRPSPAGVLLFSCLGRGRGLYGEPNHDSNAVREQWGPQVPIAGFFGNGEIGPVTGRTYLHGYTSAMALVRPCAPRP